jgi:hypothetical protein
MKERANIFSDRVGGATDDSSSSKSTRLSISRILQDIVNNATEIIRSEVRLARAEVRQDLMQIGKGSSLLVVGALLTLYALGFILLSIVSALELRLAPWLSALIVGIGVGIVGLIFLLVGRTRLKQASLKPDKTIQSLQENVTWMKKRTG